MPDRSGGRPRAPRGGTSCRGRSLGQSLVPSPILSAMGLLEAPLLRVVAGFEHEGGTAGRKDQ
jgi:hypothetical protein